MRLRRGDRVEPPYAWHALKLVFVAIFEGEARPRDEVSDGARHEHLARRGERRDARARDDRDSGDFLADDLALARVDAGTHL